MMQRRQIPKAMRAVGLTKTAVAKEAGVSWQMVNMVCKGQRTSARVLGVLERLIAERRQANGGTPPAA